MILDKDQFIGHCLSLYNEGGKGIHLFITLVPEVQKVPLAYQLWGLLMNFNWLVKRPNASTNNGNLKKG